MTSPEGRVLQAALTDVRHPILRVVDELSDEQLRQPALPSGWNCIGLLNHLAVDVERFWFRAVMAGDQGAWESFDSYEGSAWDVALGVSPATVLTLDREKISQADALIAATPLDTAPTAWPEEMFGSFRLGSSGR